MAVVAVAGLATMDFLFAVPAMPDRPEKYRADAVEIVGGGGGANAAVAIARLGGAPRFYTRLGDDAIGDMILADLSGEGLAMGHTHRWPGARSSCSSVLVDQAGERQIVNFRGDGLAPDPSWIDVATPFDAALADTRWPEGALALFAAARARGAPAVLDAEAPVPEDLARAATHVAFSEQGLRDFTGIEAWEPALLSAAARLPGWVAVTLGAEGIAWVTTGAIVRCPAFAVDVVDTLGAGDIWHGGFALALAEGQTEPDAARFANAAAALKCRALGGRKAAPSRAETDAFLKEQIQ